MCKEKERIHENYREVLRRIREGEEIKLPLSRFKRSKKHKEEEH